MKIALANGTLTNQKRLSIKLFSHKGFLVRAICFLSNIILCIISLSGEPVVITVGLWVLSIDSINVVDMVGWISLYKFSCKSNISVSKLFCNLCYPLQDIRYDLQIYRVLNHLHWEKIVAEVTSSLVGKRQLQMQRVGGRVENSWKVTNLVFFFLKCPKSKQQGHPEILHVKTQHNVS